LHLSSVVRKEQDKSTRALIAFDWLRLTILAPLPVSLFQLPPRIVGFCLALILSGCASTPVPTSRLPAPASLPPESVSSIPRPAQTEAFIYRAGTYRYDFLERTILTLGDSMPSQQTDTLSTSAILTYIIREPEPARIVTVSVDSFTVTSARDSARHVTSSLIFEQRSDSARVLPDGPVPDSCDSVREIAWTMARQVLISTPGLLKPGAVWQDTTSSQTCRGRIPLDTQTITTYRVHEPMDSAGALLLQVSRSTTLTLTGTGFQGSHAITVIGTGQGEAVLTFSLDRGAFLESSGETSMQLSFEAGRQSQTIRQTSSSQIRPRIF
jgi:hypothetical protein